MKPEELVNITSVKITVGSRDILLSVGEVLSLADALEDVLGKNPLDPIHGIDSQNHVIFCDPNSEYWPCGWQLNYGPLRQTNTLIIKA